LLLLQRCPEKFSGRRPRRALRRKQESILSQGTGYDGDDEYMRSESEALPPNPGGISRSSNGDKFASNIVAATFRQTSNMVPRDHHSDAVAGSILESWYLESDESWPEIESKEQVTKVRDSSKFSVEQICELCNEDRGARDH
jgi:hypothetical protein